MRPREIDASPQMNFGHRWREGTKKVVVRRQRLAPAVSGLRGAAARRVNSASVNAPGDCVPLLPLPRAQSAYARRAKSEHKFDNLRSILQMQQASGSLDHNSISSVSSRRVRRQLPPFSPRAARREINPALVAPDAAPRARQRCERRTDKHKAPSVHSNRRRQ